MEAFILEQKDINALVIDFLGYMKEIGYSNNTVLRYSTHFNFLIRHFKERDIFIYGEKEHEEFLIYLLDNHDYQSLTKLNKDRYRAANVLWEFHNKGQIPYRTTFKPSENEDDFIKCFQALTNYRLSMGISEKTISYDATYFKNFRNFLILNKIERLNFIEKVHLIDYIKTFEVATPSTRRLNFIFLRMFLRFLFNENIITEDLSFLVPKVKKISNPPTTYTSDEIKEMLNAIDRGSPKGKRDYAMLLLTARLGLRASDVCQLKFSEIEWEKNTLYLKQKKTGKSIELPLLPEIGNAIIDYLKYGRPKSESHFVFLEAGHRSVPLKPPTLHSIVRAALKNAKINITNRKSGPHALRHSLASNLLQNKNSLPIISEVLGHKSIETTKGYLSINISALFQCALEVCDLNPDHYSEMEVLV
jgi:integrase